MYQTLGEKFNIVVCAQYLKKGKFSMEKLSFGIIKKTSKTYSEFRPLKSFKCNYNTLAYMYNIDNRVIIRYHQ